MDRIIIKDLEVFYRVGISPQERGAAQRLLLTIELNHDLEAAAKEDDLGTTIDYFAVAQRLLGLGEGREWKLLESVAEEAAQTILREFGGVAISVEVKKFVVPKAAYVSVRIDRRR
jgi:7,8-dihydroneopterin aldolase/epimerase/oxygenase